MATKWVFVCGGDSCGACSALAGTVSDQPLGQQHDNCMCDSIPLNAGEDCPKYTFHQVGTERYGPGGGSAGDRGSPRSRATECSASCWRSRSFPRPPAA